jgi:glycosyltransferase involved in cell wall biosynthesis
MTALPNNLAQTRGHRVVPRLAIVVPARDRRNCLPRTLGSVLSDPHPDFELVVIDDGSVDGTEAYLASIDDPRFVWRRFAAPLGANPARNAGAALSSAPLIAFLDSDDAFCPGRIGRLLDFFDANPEIDCSIDGFDDVSHDGHRLHRLPQPTPDPERLIQLLLCHCVPLTNSTVTVRRTAFESIGGYDPGLKRHQDREFLVRLGRQRRIAFGKATDVLKYREPNSISHAHAGYIEGLDDFVARCPEYRTGGYLPILNYLTLRGILKALAQGRFGVASKEIWAWRRAHNLPAASGILAGYFHGRRQRRDLERSLAARVEPFAHAAATTSAE